MLGLDDAWDAFLLVLGNPLEGLFTPLINAATGLFTFLTENWATIWETIKSVGATALVAIGDTLTGGLVSFGLRVYDWATGLVRLAPVFYQAATEWAANLWRGLTEWLETATAGIGGFFGDLFGDLFGDTGTAPQQFGPTVAAGGYGPQEIVINNRLELDGETLGRSTVRLLGEQFGRRAIGR